MGAMMTVRDLANEHPEIRDHDYKWADGESPAFLEDVLARHGWRLAEPGIAGEYNDIKAYYACVLLPL